MRFQHAAEIWTHFPALRAAALSADRVRPDLDVTAVARPFLDTAVARLATIGSESELPQIAAWRRAFATMGLKPTQYRCAAEALLRRLRKDGTLPQVHPLIDLCNAVSVAAAIPIAVFDLDRIDGDLTVRHATGDERYHSFTGEIEHPPAGEVVFADSRGTAHARRWTHRQAATSAVGPDTRRVLIVAEALHDTAAEDVAVLEHHLHEALTAADLPVAAAAQLTAEHPSVDLPNRDDG